MAIARWFFEKKGLRTRLYIADGGLETVESDGLLEDGIVEAFQFNTRTDPFYTSSKICEGYWPKDPKDPKSPLVKPNLAEYSAKFGMTVYEGLTFMADWMMGDSDGGLTARSARGEKIGQDAAYVLTEGDAKWGSNPPAHYGFVQRRIEDNIERTRALPGWIQWTAHERKAEDKEIGSKETEFGPDICGSALTTKIGGRFGNTIHLHPIKRLVKVKDTVAGKDVDVEEVHYRAYTRKHFDPLQRSYYMYYANNRMPAMYRADMPEFLEPPDALKFYQILENAKEKRRIKDVDKPSAAV